MNRLDRRSLRMAPLAERVNKLRIEEIAVSPETYAVSLGSEEDRQVRRTAEAVLRARRAGRAVVLAFGAHAIKNGLGPLLGRLATEGWVTHLATNGAGSIHDWEFAFQGQSTEDVRVNTARGCFGTWEETGRWINLAVAVGGAEGLGYGESVGRLIAEGGLTIPSEQELRGRVSAALDRSDSGDEAAALADLLALVREGVPAGRAAVAHPYAAFSAQRAAYEAGVPFTVHPGIGYDILYTHPLNSGGAIGRGAVRDFQAYAASISRLEGGVHLSVGSAIMAPMIFEKSLSMANNLAILQRGRPLSDYQLVVNDIQDGGGWDWRSGEPPMEHPAYYLRFCKTFYRMGGELEYIGLDNRDLLVALYLALTA